MDGILPSSDLNTNINPMGRTNEIPAPPVPPPTSPQPQPKTVTFQRKAIYFEKTQNSIQRLEDKLNGRVLVFYDSSSISSDQVKYLYSHLRKMGKQDKLYFVMYSHGGDGKSAYRIAHLLRNFCQELIVVIPEVAASAATMLALAGDSILMTPLAYLTAVDTSLTHPLNPKGVDGRPVRVELEEINRARDLILKDRTDSDKNMEAYKTIFTYLHPVSLGAMERSSSLSEMLCRDILDLKTNKLPSDMVDSLVHKLNREYPAHGYPINRIKARELGLRILDTDKDLDDLLFDAQNLYRFLSDSVRTDINDTFYHLENYITMMETIGFRTFNKAIWERKIDPVIKNWTVVKDETKWYGAFESEQEGKKSVMLTTMDL